MKKKTIMRIYACDKGRFENRFLYKPTDLEGFQNFDTINFYSIRIRPGQLIKYIVTEVPVSELTVSTYGFDLASMKTLEMLRRKGKIGKLSLILDRQRYFSRYKSSNVAKSTFDYVGVFDNHSKVWLFDAPDIKITVVSSMNIVAGANKDAGIPVFDNSTS